MFLFQYDCRTPHDYKKKRLGRCVKIHLGHLALKGNTIYKDLKHKYFLGTSIQKMMPERKNIGMRAVDKCADRFEKLFK